MSESDITKASKTCSSALIIQSDIPKGNHCDISDSPIKMSSARDIWCIYVHVLASGFDSRFHVVSAQVTLILYIQGK